MSSPKTIGILGGMGPEATVLMMQRIIQYTDAGTDQEHIPMLVDNNTQVPSRINRLIRGTGADPGPVLAKMAQQLEMMGAEALVMPCNTAHRYAEIIKEQCNIPLINMIEAVSDEIARAAPLVTRVGILASPAVRMIELFEEPLRVHGVQVVYHSDDTELLRLIETIKSYGPSKSSGEQLSEVARKMHANGADCLVTACTEFSLLFKDLDLPVPMFDSLDVVCRSVVSFALPTICQGKYGGSPL